MLYHRLASLEIREIPNSELEASELWNRNRVSTVCEEMALPPGHWPQQRSWWTKGSTFNSFATKNNLKWSRIAAVLPVGRPLWAWPKGLGKPKTQVPVPWVFKTILKQYLKTFLILKRRSSANMSPSSGCPGMGSKLPWKLNESAQLLQLLLARDWKPPNCNLVSKNLLETNF